MGSDSKKSGGNVQGGGGGLPIPAEEKKIVQNLKEIVGKNFTDAEIYAVLLDCNMDPDDAVNRLLSQDTFHEVKSKRERRKEVKETQESRSRNNNSASNWGVRLGSEHVAGWTGSTENNYNELGKASYKRENLSAAPSVSSSSSYVYRATGKILNEKPLPHSDSSNADNRRQSTGASDTITSSIQPLSGLQSSWSGVSKGHVSMADIVKMGTQLSKGSQMSSEVSYAPQQDASSNLPHYCIKSSQISTTPDSEMHQDLYSSHPSNVSETIHESGMTAGQHGFDNKWPLYEHQTAASGSLFDASCALDTELYSNQSSLHSDRAYMSRNSQSQELQVSERDVDSQNLNSNYNGSDSAASRQIFVNSAGGSSNDDSLKETSSYVSHGHIHNHQEGISNSSDLPFPSYSASLSDDVLSAVSSAAANLQQLNIGRVEPAKPLTEDNSAVVLPIYLQAFAADCSHLSFGTYKSGVASAPIAPISSNSSKSNLEVSAVVDGSSALHWNIRNSGYQDDEQLGFMHDTHRAAADSRKYESQVPSQQEFMKQDIPETTHGDQYMATSSVLDSSNKNTQQSNSNLAFARDPNAKNLPLPNEMLSYAKSIPSPSGLLASTVQSLRARDSSPFLAAQSIPLKYSAAMPSLNSPISMSEVLNSSAYSLHPPASQALPGSNLAKGNVLPQHLSVHPYAQPEMSLRELANMTGYPSMPQSQTYVPPALPQPYPDSSAFHDSRAGMHYNLSQYRSGAAMNSMPKGSNVGYGSFVGSSTNLPGSFLHNLSTSHTGTGAGYEDLLRSQIKDGNVIAQQQNSGFYGRDFGNSTRTMSPESAYYNLLGQNPQHAGYQQSQQASQHYETLGGGYPKMYRSRTGTGREQQQQNLGDYTSNDSQDTTSNQFNQIWGHRY